MHDEQKILSNCLDSLQEAAEALEEFDDPDRQISLWYDNIQKLYGQIDDRYSK